MTERHLIMRSFLMPALTVLITTIGTIDMATATTYYVAKTGTDSYGCAQAQKPSTPKLTIAAGLACLASGDTLQVRAGTYAEAISNPVGGTAGAYTVIRNYPGERPILRPKGASNIVFLSSSARSYIELRGFELDGSNSATGNGRAIFLCGSASATSCGPGAPHHIRIVGNIIHDTYQHMMFVSPQAESADHEILYNEWYRGGSHYGPYTPGFNTMYGTGNRTLIEGNVVHNVCWGFNVYTSVNVPWHGVIIRNNLFYDVANIATDPWQSGMNCTAAISVFVAGSGHQIYNNIVIRAKQGIVHKHATGSKIYNNTIYQTLGGPAIGAYAPTNVEVRNNIAYQAGGITLQSGTGIQSNNLTTDPMFASPANHDFRLRTGSPAIDAGVSLVEVPFDFARNPRPQGTRHDIGAHEYTLSLTAPLQPENVRVD